MYRGVSRCGYITSGELPATVSGEVGSVRGCDLSALITDNVSIRIKCRGLRKSVIVILPDGDSLQ